MRNNNVVSNGNSAQQSLMEQKQQLPILSAQHRFIEEVRKTDSTIVLGETACGKTTQIPQFLLKNGYAKTGRIGCTQPRRVAAVTVAQRVARELSCNVGEKVGYAVRFDDQTSPQTKIKFMTDGMLLREAMGDPLLRQYSFLILDEAHERTIHTDVLFGIVKEAQQIRKKSDNNHSPLKLIIMSATMDADRFSRYFDDAPVLYVEGRQHEIKTKYIKTPSDDYLTLAASTVIKIHEEEPAGDDILVFLTGREEIESMVKLLKDIAATLPSNLPTLKIFPLYASLPHNQQLRAFRNTPENSRKVVLSTNIAETSVTILGIKFVVDTGKVKCKTFDPSRGLDILKVQWVSQAQAWQRSGRAGRHRSGVVMRLYTEEMFNKFSVDTIPEIKRCNASNVLLQLLSIGVNDITKFDFFDAPDRKSISCAIDELTLLGAIERDLNGTDGGTHQLTKLGRLMASFPLEPKLSKALVTAEKYDCLEEMLTLVAMMSVDNILFAPQSKLEQAHASHHKFSSSEGDFVKLMCVYRAFKQAKANNEWCYENFVNHRSMLQVQDIRKQLRELCVKHQIALKSSARDTRVLRRCVASGMFANAAEYQQDGTYRVLSSGQVVKIHPSSCLFRSKPAYVIYGELVQTSECYMRTICVVDPEWLYESAPEFFRSKINVNN